MRPPSPFRIKRWLERGGALWIAVTKVFLPRCHPRLVVTHLPNARRHKASVVGCAPSAVVKPGGETLGLAVEALAPWTVEGPAALLVSQWLKCTPSLHLALSSPFVLGEWTVAEVGWPPV